MKTASNLLDKWDEEFADENGEYNLHLFCGKEKAATITVADYAEAVLQSFGWLKFGVDKYNDDTFNVEVEYLGKSLKFRHKYKLVCGFVSTEYV